DLADRRLAVLEEGATRQPRPFHFTDRGHGRPPLLPPVSHPTPEVRPGACGNVGDRMSASRRSALEQRRLGRTDMVVSVLGFGGSEIGYQGVSGRTVGRLLGGALDAGLNVIDTAECYDESEKLIGKAIGSRRREVYPFTKCRHPRGPAP